MKAELLKPTTDAELEKYCSREEVLVARGIEGERKKWIKEAIRAGILISKPEELVGIITTSLADICLKHRQAGIREVFDWQQEPCPHKDGSYFARHCVKCKQAKLREWNIE